MRKPRHGLVVYQLLLILLVVALLLWLIIALVNRNGPAPSITPADSAVIDTAPVPVPTAPDTMGMRDSLSDSIAAAADTMVP